MTGVSSGQGMVGCCRMGSRAGVCASPGPSDMALSAPSWAECGHCHINLETGRSPARGLQLALPSVGRKTDGGGPTSMPNVLPVEGHRNPATQGKKEKRPSSCASQHLAWSGNPPSAFVLPPGQDLSLRTALGAAGWGGAPASRAWTCLHSTGQGERPQGGPAPAPTLTGGGRSVFPRTHGHIFPGNSVRGLGTWGYLFPETAQRPNYRTQSSWAQFP